MVQNKLSFSKCFVISIIVHIVAVLVVIATTFGTSLYNKLFGTEVFIGNVDVAFYSPEEKIEEAAPIQDVSVDDKEPVFEDDVIMKNKKDKKKNKKEIKEEVEPTQTGKVSARSAARSSQFSNLAMNVANFPYAQYINSVVMLVGKQWQWTEESYTKLRTVLQFTVKRNGTVSSDIKIVKSSGNEKFDRMAKRAIINVEHFPPLPDDFKGDYITVHFEFKNRR